MHYDYLFHFILLQTQSTKLAELIDNSKYVVTQYYWQSTIICIIVIQIPSSCPGEVPEVEFVASSSASTVGDAVIANKTLSLI